jgi:hypothetical protein
MARRLLLVELSTAQLAAQLAGAAVAVRRTVTYDIPFLHGRPERVLRDALWLGSAFSAPTPMMAVQAWATVRLTIGPSDAARRTLTVLGTAMIPGVLLERRDRQRLTPDGFDRVETPLVASTLGLAVAMALAGRRQSR